MQINLLKVLLPSLVAFIVGIAFTPFLTSYLYKHEMWKKKAKSVALGGGGTPVFDSLHGEKKEVGTPRMGGIVIWVAAVLTTLLFWLLGHFFPTSIFAKLDFLSRDQTWIPLVVFLFGAIVGMVDDLLEIKGSGGNYAGGLSFKKRVSLVALIAFAVACWFYFKLDVRTLSIPFAGVWNSGWLFIPVFILVTVFIYSGTVIDGIDGLSGGVFSTIFGAYALIAFFQHQYNLAAFCAVVIGGILAFLWFNIPPARFYMTETGSMALTMTIAIVAFMTDSLGGGRGLAVLPVIALPLVVTTFSVIIQVASKRLRNGKKVFRIAPLHHHFEALGWPSYKVTMRYWIVSFLCAGFGVIIALIKI